MSKANILDKVKRRLFLTTRQRMHPDGRLVIAPDEESARLWNANNAGEPTLSSAVDVGEYYGPYLPGTEKLLRFPGDVEIPSIIPGVPKGTMTPKMQDYSDSDSYFFTPEDYLFMKHQRKLRKEREEYLRRKALEDYMNRMDLYPDEY